MPDLSPDLHAQLLAVLEKLVAEAGLGPGSYVLIATADASRETTLAQYNWWWRPPEEVPPDIVDRFRAGPLD